MPVVTLVVRMVPPRRPRYRAPLHWLACRWRSTSTTWPGWLGWPSPTRSGTGSGSSWPSSWSTPSGSGRWPPRTSGPPLSPCPKRTCSATMTTRGSACPRTWPWPARPRPRTAGSRSPGSPRGSDVTELCDLPAHELARMFRAREATALDATESCLRRIDALDDRIDAFLQVTGDLARDRARGVDERFRTGEGLAPAAGIPLALKDVLCTKGITTTCGSRILHNYVPPYDCTPWARLRAAGGVLIGKTNCDEFAMGSSNENSAFRPVHNPWDLDRVPGGSSGGSAAAVAAGEAVWALGTDTGGSVRQPGALCGVVALKPTYGLISRYGLIAFASSLDHVGTFTRDVRDCATLLSAIASKDPMDATSLPTEPRDYTEGLDEDVRGLRIGVVRDWLGEGVEPGVRAAIESAIERLAGLGMEIGETSLPHTDHALSAYYLIAPAEASSNLARYDGVRYGHRADGARDLLRMYTETRDQGFDAEV